MSLSEAPGALLTALILTHNEEANIGRTLDHLGWLDSILVIDSGSSDATLSILAGHPSVQVLHRPFDSFADQCNFGLDQITSPWVLSLDADYLIPPPLAAEIQAVIRDPAATAMAGYAIPFRYCIGGRPLRSGMLPPRTSLYRAGQGRYRNDGHGHRIVLSGPVGRLRQPIFHDDRKPLQRWLASQGSYLAIEAAKLRATPWRQLSLADRLRKHTPLAPFAALLFCLVWKGGGAGGLARLDLRPATHVCRTAAPSDAPGGPLQPLDSPLNAHRTLQDLEVALRSALTGGPSTGAGPQFLA